MTDHETIKRELQSDTDLLIGLIPKDHKQAGVEIVKRMNRHYSDWASIAAQQTVDDWFQSRADTEDALE